MVNYFIYAKDFSGSTEGVKYYHRSGLQSLKDFKKHVEKVKEELLLEKGDSEKEIPESKIVYLHWGSRCFEVDENETITTYKNFRSGNMGTNPETIIECLKQHYILSDNDKIKLLYIITDGLIGSGSAEECFKLNEDVHYETVVFHAFNKNLNEVDLSVAASFFKSQCMIYRNYELFGNTDIAKEFDYDKIDLDNFSTEKDELLSYIKLKFIKNFRQNSIALQEIDKLKKLRDRLFQTLALSSKPENSTRTKVNLETKDKNEFLQEFVKTDWYKNLTGSVFVDKLYIDKAISTCINYIVSESKSYSFDAMKFDKQFDESVEEQEMIDAHFTAEQEIEFPDIILDDEKGIPVIILTDFNLINKIIYKGKQQSLRPDIRVRKRRRRMARKPVSPASFCKFKSTMDCPLFLANDRDISQSIGYFYTLTVYKQFLANHTRSEPRTRRPFHGGIVLTDTDQFDKYNDYILAATYFGSKKVNYNVGLFYYVLWKNCEKKEWMDRNVVEQFKKYTLRRISEAVYKIGLSSLPVHPRLKTSLLTALWYCTELSTCIFKNDSQHFNQERLRMYHGVVRHMIDILKYFNYNLDVETIEKRRELIGDVMQLKKIRKKGDKVHYLLGKIFKTDNGFLISEIENPSNLYKMNYLKLNHKEMLRDDVVNDKVNLNDYIHLMHIEGDLETSKAGEGSYEICKETFHPFFVIDNNKCFYTELVKKTKKIVIKNDFDNNNIEVAYEPIKSLEFDRTLSRYKLYIDCVKDLQEFPELDEFVKYVLEKKKLKKNLVTIFPPNVYFDLKNVYERYQSVLVDVTLSQFITACRIYVNRRNRVKAEKRKRFKNNNEIVEFINKQALKVNLDKMKN